MVDLQLKDVLAIVPARGGSVGIPRKNVRVIGGEPLVLQRLRTLRAAGLERVVCSTNDPVVASIARMAGFEVHARSAATAGPAATIADVVAEVAADLQWPGPVAVFQPTSPGLDADRIRLEVARFLDDPGQRTAASVEAVTDVCWTADGPIGRWENRQTSATSVWRETGGMRLVKDPAILPVMVDMAGHHLIELDPVQAIDVDDHAQLAGVRQALAATNVTFVAAAGRATGSGHVHRCLTLADELAHHRVRFVLKVDPGCDPEPWEQMITGAGFELSDTHGYGGLVVLDVLAADPATVWTLKQTGVAVVVLEDDGPGARAADLVVNELHDDHGTPGWYCGPDWAVLRPEFLTGTHHFPTLNPYPDQARVLTYFGGTDPAGLAARVVPALGAAGFAVSDATGYAGDEGRTLAELMATCDVFVTAAGRAVHAAAHVGIPTISIPANGRETTHLRLDSVLRMPRAEICPTDEIVRVVGAVAGNLDLRREMSMRGQACVDGAGARRIANLIDNLVEEQ